MSTTSIHKLAVEFTSDTEVVMTRHFDAPLDRVYQAFVDPDLIPNWWGQRGSTLKIASLDLNPGGMWRYLITDPDGSEYAYRGVYQEIVPNAKLSYSFEYEPMPGQIVQITDLFTEKHGTTTVTELLTFDTLEQRDAVFQSGMEDGAAEFYDRLEELLATLH